MSENETPGRQEKVATGIEGFDSLTGGIAANRATLLIGGTGSGKTAFALQTLVSGAKSGEPGIYIGFDADPDQFTKAGAQFGWDVPDLERRGMLFSYWATVMRDAAASEAGFLAMLENLSTLTRQMKARRIVFDSFDVLLRNLNDADAEMRLVFQLRDWLFRHDFTVLLTARLTTAEPRAAQRYAFLQIVADCSVALACEQKTTHRFLRVLKYRGSKFIEYELPFVVGKSGIEVSLPASPSRAEMNLPPDFASAREQLQASIQPLDRFLEMKQAELDFLLERETNQESSGGGETPPPRDS